MAAWLPAVRFMVAMQRKGGATPREVADAAPVVVAGQAMRCRRFHPRGRSRGRVLVLHGVTPRGVDDPRMALLADSLAVAGFEVVAPEFPNLRRADLSPATVATIREVLAGLGPDVRVLAPSFAAGLCLRAVAEGAQVRSVCAIGGYGDVRQSLGRLLSRDVDAYARIAVVLNMGRLNERECDVLRTWLYDDSVRPVERRYPAVRQTLDDSEGRRVDGIIDGSWPELDAWFDQIPDVVDAIDVSSVAADIRVPVVLIHGSSDRVIPPVESVRLAERLPRAHLCVTPLLTHGDTKSPAEQPGAVLGLARAFATFLG